jgi:hypothetical protein
MDTKEVLEHYVEQSNRLFTNIWQAINALFPNIDLDFSIRDPKERKAVIDHEKFLQSLPKGSEVALGEDKVEDYSGMCVFIFLPENEDMELWNKQIELKNCDDCRFFLEYLKE